MTMVATKGKMWLAARIKHGDRAICAVFGCGRLTMQAAGEGLSAFHCRQHTAHRARSGSLWCRSIRAGELAPYLKAATSYIRPRLETDPHIREAVKRLALMLEMAPYEPAFRLRGLRAPVLADIAFGRLRRKGIKPERLLAIYLSIIVLLEENPGGAWHCTKEFRLVQTARCLHRLASGHHQSWPVLDRNGREHLYTQHKYPPRGARTLRIMGQRVEDICEFVAEAHGAGVLALKVRRYGAAPLATSAAT